MESEDGDGMEPPNSVQDDGSPATGEDGESNGFSIVDDSGDAASEVIDAAENTESTENEADAAASDDASNDDTSNDEASDTENADSDSTDSEDTDSDVAIDDDSSDEDTSNDDATNEDVSNDDSSDDDELSADEWLDAAKPGGTDTSDEAGTAAVGVAAAAAAASGTNMSDIMAELLAAAEKSAEDDEKSEADAANGDETIAAPEKPTRPTADDSKDSDSEDAESKDTESKDTGSGDPESKDKAASDDKDGDEDKDENKDVADEKSDDAKTNESKDKSDDKKTGDAKDKTDNAEGKTDDAKDKASDAEGKTGDAKDKADNKTDAEDKPDNASDKTKKAVAAAIPAAAAKATSGKSSFPVLKAAVITVIGLYALLVAAWGVDMARHSDKAMRGVQLASVDVGGLDRAELDDTVDELTNDLGDRSLSVEVGDETITTDPVTLGARLDRDRMVNEALDARRSGLFFVRPITWAAGLFSTETVETRYLVDADAAGRAAEDVIESELDQAVEPTLELEGSRMTVTPGSPGVSVEPREIVGRLPAAIEAGEPYELTLMPQDSEPQLETAAITELADEINEQTEEAIAVQVLDDEAEISPRMMKSWVDLEIIDDEPTWVVSEERALEDLKPLFPGLGSEDQQATFKVVNEEPIIVPASETVVCCAAGIGEDLQRVINRGLPAMVTEEDEDGEEVEVQPLRNITLEPEVTGFDEGVAELEALGIVELASTFTTKHACCANRVKNIQRFADLTQGVIIRPGEEFSLNGFVGRRTIENGFVADGAIALGNFEQQVGGGISQYATTFFNASFFAGVEFLEYQSHSIYISRYPRGREATISWRKPDLKIRNNTEYGILVWNEYTPTSITVSFYSTKHLTVEALPLKRSSDRQCRIDITPRLITYPDGSQSEDRVFASYRPGEGLDCNGNSTTPDEDPPAPAAPAAAPEPTPAPEPDPPDPDDGEVLPGG